MSSKKQTSAKIFGVKPQDLIKSRAERLELREQTCEKMKQIDKEIEKEIDCDPDIFQIRVTI